MNMDITNNNLRKPIDHRFHVQHVNINLNLMFNITVSQSTSA